MRNLAIIPARSGSKGVKNKNIRQLYDKPLLAYTIESAKESELFEEIHVSTDSEVYAKVATEWGASVPFLRSEELSTDTASPWDMVKATIQKYKVLGKEFDTISLLQPTSPLRKASDIVEGYKLLENKCADSIVAVCEMDHSPLWSNTLPANCSLENFIAKENFVGRQKLETFYRINGALYIVRADKIEKGLDLYGSKSYAYIMPRERSVDIDTELDFIIAEAILSKLN